MAFAKDSSNAALDKVLVSEEGMTLVADGLYMEKTASGASYVATNNAGRESLRGIVQNDLDTQRARLTAKGRADTGAGIVASLERVLERFDAELQGKVSQTAYCPGGAQIYARALSNSGTSASGYAVNALDFSPATPTTNRAEASTDNVYNAQTTIGMTPANASANEPGSCWAYGYASVTCVGETTPRATAYAYSSGRSPSCLQ
jgi:hypothetical protein